MVRLLIYTLIFGAILYLLGQWKKNYSGELFQGQSKKSKSMFRAKDPQELWVQVYETLSLEEARRFQARLQEEEIDCVLYQQGKKDIQGNPLKGIGIAVPKTAMPQAQGIITRLSV